MLTSNLVSLPHEMLRQLNESEHRSHGGGSTMERSAGIAVFLVAVALAPVAMLLVH